MTGSATVKLFALGLLVSAAAGCSPIVATHGNIVEAERLGEIHEGTSNKSDVANTLGTPTATGTLDPNTWYYIGQRTEKVAFFAPDVVERKVVVFHFDESSVLRKIDQVDLAAGQDIDIVSRTTTRPSPASWPSWRRTPWRGPCWCPGSPAPPATSP